MCKVIETYIGKNKVKVADIKKKYLENVVDAAGKCDYIDRIIVFGSSTNSECKEESDIDLAIFGNVARGKCLTSKKYENFLKQVYSYDDFRQSYDILYFKSGQKYKDSLIMDNIGLGELLYEA